MQSVKHRAFFLTRPDLDSDDFTDYGATPVIGHERVIEQDQERWRIAEIQQDDTDVETIVFVPVRDE